jgi:hypothetical protein
VPLLNYTTTVAPSRTVNEVHNLLVKAGARSILVDYLADQRPVAVAFVVETPLGTRSFRLPVNAESVRKVLYNDRKVERRYKTADQAERVAWRIVKDWLEAQLAIIETEMVSLDQVMLPYMQGDDGRTVYQLYLDQQLALPKGD